MNWFKETFMGDWETTYKNGMKEVQQHSLTCRYRSTMYDMAYGETYWIKGDFWSGN